MHQRGLVGSEQDTSGERDDQPALLLLDRDKLGQRSQGVSRLLLGRDSGVLLRGKLLGRRLLAPL